MPINTKYRRSSFPVAKTFGGEHDAPPECQEISIFDQPVMGGTGISGRVDEPFDMREQRDRSVSCQLLTNRYPTNNAEVTTVKDSDSVTIPDGARLASVNLVQPISDP